MRDLGLLYSILEMYYVLYTEEVISQKQYLSYIKPIDKAIDKIEISILQGNPVPRESSL